MISKLMGLASIGSSLANVSLLYRFLEGIISLIALTIVSAMMAGMLLVSGFYLLFVELTHYGLDPRIAFVTVLTLALALTLALIGVMLVRLQHLRSLPDLLIPRGSLPVAHTLRLAKAFFEGFKARSSNY